MKKIKYILLVLTTPFFINSCDNIDFGDINNNPNGPTSGVTSQLLTNAEVSISSIVSSNKGSLFTQQLTEGQYPSNSRYAQSTSSYSGWYTGALTDLNRVISLNENPETKEAAKSFGDNNNQIAVAKLIKSYILHTLTDRWGGLPLSEAFKGIEQPKPKFDTQEEIYDFLFSEIDDALSKINSNTGPKGDFILNGDMSKWRIFGNSLKMVMALRISDIKPSLAKSKFEQAANSGYIIKNNSDNILFPYGTDEKSDNPWYESFVYDGREDYILSVTLTEKLRSKLDPRLLKFGQESENGVVANPLFPNDADKRIVGAPNGTVNGNVRIYSLPTKTVIEDADYKIPIFTASQIKFSLAEAKLKGWNISGSVSDLFKSAIEESMRYWGVSEVDITSYIAKNPFNSIKDIAYEKWVSFFMLQPYESWAEWRRFDFPVLIPSSDGVESFIPLRDAYDSSIIDNNIDNYKKIVEKQGADKLDTKLWWDVK